MNKANVNIMAELLTSCPEVEAATIADELKTALRYARIWHRGRVNNDTRATTSARKEITAHLMKIYNTCQKLAQQNKITYTTATMIFEEVTKITDRAEQGAE